MGKETPKSSTEGHTTHREPVEVHSFEDEAAFIVGSHNAQLERQSRAAELKSYLEDFPELYEHVQEYKVGLLASLEKFKNDVRLSHKNGAVFEKVIDDFSRNFDSIIVKLFECIGVKNNPNIRARILSNTYVPTFIASEYSNPFRKGEVYTDENGIHTIVLFPNAQPFLSSPQTIVSTIVHEFAHAYIEGFEVTTYTRNEALNEGITDYIAQNTSPLYAGSYILENKIAHCLMKLDKDAVMEWYTGGNDETLHEKITSALLKKGKSFEEAAGISGHVISLGRYIRNIEEFYKAQKRELLVERTPLRKVNFEKEQEYEAAQQQISLLLENPADKSLENLAGSNSKAHDVRMELYALDEKCEEEKIAHYEFIIAQLG